MTVLTQTNSETFSYRKPTAKIYYIWHDLEKYQERVLMGIFVIFVLNGLLGKWWNLKAKKWTNLSLSSQQLSLFERQKELKKMSKIKDVT